MPLRAVVALPMTANPPLPVVVAPAISTPLLHADAHGVPQSAVARVIAEPRPAVAQRVPTPTAPPATVPARAEDLVVSRAAASSMAPLPAQATPSASLTGAVTSTTSDSVPTAHPTHVSAQSMPAAAADPPPPPAASAADAAAPVHVSEEEEDDAPQTVSALAAPEGGYSVYVHPPEGVAWPADMPFLAPLLGAGIPVVCIDRRRLAREVLLWLDISVPSVPALIIQRGARNPHRIRDDERLRLMDIIDIRMGSSASMNSERAFTFTGDLFNVVIEAPTQHGASWMFQQFARLFHAYAAALQSGCSDDAITDYVQQFMETAENAEEAAFEESLTSHAPAGRDAMDPSPRDEDDGADEDPSGVAAAAALAAKASPEVQVHEVAAAPLQFAASATTAPSDATVTTTAPEPQHRDTSDANMHDDVDAGGSSPRAVEAVDSPVATADVVHGLMQSPELRAVAPESPAASEIAAAQQYDDDFETSVRSMDANGARGKTAVVSGEAVPTSIAEHDIAEEVLEDDTRESHVSAAHERGPSPVHTVPAEHAPGVTAAATDAYAFDIEDVDDEDAPQVIPAEPLGRSFAAAAAAFGDVDAVALLPDDEDQLSLGPQEDAVPEDMDVADAASDGNVSDYF